MTRKKWFKKVQYLCALGCALFYQLFYAQEDHEEIKNLQLLSIP